VVDVLEERRLMSATAGSWIARLDGFDGTFDEQLSELNSRFAEANINLRAKQHLGDDGLFLVRSAEHLRHKQALRRLKAVADVSLFQSDGTLHAGVLTPDDTSFGQQWALDNTGQTGGTIDADIDASEAWEVTTGDESIIVGVIDTGIDYTHPDLSDNIWVNPGEIADNNRDDDGNGYIDDVHGWDFFNNDNDPMDDNDHGTHVAGTIAAAGNNSTGISGVGWDIKVMALKFLGEDGTGAISDAIAAINYATMMHTQFSINIRLTNNSWAGGAFVSALQSAIQASAEAGMLFVAAAGNGGSDGVGDNNDEDPIYPAGYEVSNVISVAATDHNDALGSFSNFGAASVHLGAPGVSVLSTTPNSTYRRFSGTSMATPHVSAVAALAWSVAPNADYLDIKNAILAGVDATPALEGKTITGGRLNANNTVRLLVGEEFGSEQLPDAAPPAAPINFKAKALSKHRIRLTWKDVASDENGYLIERSVNGTHWTVVRTTKPNARQFTDQRLRRNTTFQYRLRAFNEAGESEATSVDAATTMRSLWVKWRKRSNS
jgi:subtilisin family serine protease